MNNKLLYWVDVFTPKPYTQPTKNSSLYLVIIPCILKTESNEQDIIDYLKSFNDSTATYLFNPIAEQVKDSDETELDIVPLPFHPSVQISKSDARINTYNNETGYFFADHKAKLDYTINNYSSLSLNLIPPHANYPKNDYIYLTEKQRASYGNWLISLLTDVKKNEAKITANSLRSLVLQKIWFDKVAEKITEEIKAPLLSGTICVQYIELLTANAKLLLNEKELTPPAFQFSIEILEDLRDDAPAIEKRIGIEKNYNKIVAKGFLGVYENMMVDPEPENPEALLDDDKKQQEEDKTPIGRTVQQLRLYYGGGERVRVPELAKSYHYMQIFDDFTPSGFAENIIPTVLKTKDILPDRLTLTNNYSLLGHVVELPFSDLQDIDVFIKSLDIKLNNQQIFDQSSYADDLRIQIKAAYLNATQNKPKDFLRNIEVNPTKSQIAEKGKVYYYPSNSMAIPDAALNSAASTWEVPKQFFLLPEILLDEMESKPRVEYRSENSKLYIDFPPQRKFFKRTEIWSDGIKDDNGNEIYPPIYTHNDNNGFLPGVTVKVLLKNVTLLDGTTVFKISKKNEGFCHKEDADRFKTLLMTTISSNETDFDCFLGYSDSSVNPPSFKLITFNTLKGIEADEDELLEYYTADSLSELLELKEVATTKEASLILIAKEKTDERFWNCFNLLAAIPQKGADDKTIAIATPFVALTDRFKYKFNISVNGFTANLQTKLSKAATFKPSNLAGQFADPVITDYSNFNKFRVHLKNGNKLIKINDSDALLPEREYEEGKGNDAVFNFIYPVTHRFSESTSRTGTRNEENDPEEERYQLYKNGGQPHALEGWVEHQYAYRLNTKSSKTVSLGHSAAIRHLGKLLTIKTAKVNNEKNPASPDHKEEIPAVFFKINKAANKIEVFLKREYLEFVKTQKDSPQYFRELYEALYDLRNNASRLKVVVEQWDFNNRSNPIDASAAAHPEKSNKFPSILNNLEKKKIDEFSPILKSDLDFLYQDTYAAFKAFVVPTAHPKIMELNLYEPLTSDIVRLGIEITRESNTTVAVQFTEGGKINPAKEDLTPTPISIGTDAGTTAIESFKSANALPQLINFFKQATNEHENELYRSFSFIYSEDSIIGFGQKNILEILGETASYTALPETIETLTDVSTYYVPYSFIPLKQPYWSNTELTTAQDQYEFVNYLFKILAFLAYPENQKGNINDFINLKWETEEAGKPLKLEAFHVRSRVRDEFLHGIKDKPETSIASKVAALLAPTDNAEDPGASLEHQKVKKMRDTIEKTLKSTFSSIFIADPLKYVTLKAIGLGLFTENNSEGKNPGQFNDLYSFKVEKEISGASIKKSLMPAITDANVVKTESSEFNFFSLFTDRASRQVYYVDELSDELYDNEFHISPDINKGMEGRTAENVMENNALYGEPSDKKSKLSIKPYCQSWDQFYLLPSRKPPVVPINITLKNEEKMLVKKFEGDDVVEWDSVIKTLKKEYELTTGFGSNALAFKQYLKNPVYFNEIPGKVPENFKKFDTYVNQYYFLLDPDEEYTIDNDVIEIHIGDADDREIKDFVGDKIADADIRMELEKQFIYHIRNKNGQEDMPKPVTEVKNLVDTSKDYAIATGLHELLLNVLVSDKQQHGLSGNDQVFELRTPNGPDHWYLKKVIGANTPHTQPGDVLGVNLLKYAPDPNKPEKFLLKIMVLAEPWSHKCCTVRIRRNERDFDSNGVPDLNPVFKMQSALAPWVDYGLQFLSYNYLDAEDSSKWPQSLKYVGAEVNFAKYKSDINARYLEDVVSRILRNGERFNKTVLKNHFIQLISNRPGYNLISTFHSNKPLKDIKAWGAGYGDKIDILQVEKFAKEDIEKDALYKVDYAVNPVDTNVVGLAPFIQMIWFNDEAQDQPVFAINWQLRLKQNKA